MMMMTPSTLLGQTSLLLVALTICVHGLSLIDGQLDERAPDYKIKPRWHFYSFDEFVAKFNKTYKSQVERSRREAIFLRNQQQSFVSVALYSKGQATMYQAINHFSDLTLDEFRANMGTSSSSWLKLAKNNLVGTNKKQTASSLKLNKLKKDVMLLNKMLVSQEDDHDSGIELDDFEEEPKDNGMVWTEVLATWKRHPSYPKVRTGLRDRVFNDLRSCMNVARHQGQCGSCAVFSTIGIYEWAYCNKNGVKIDFSEQYVLDCATQLGLHICEHGIYESEVAEFVHQYGFELAHPYKYQGIELECPYKKGTSDKKRGFLRLDRPELRDVPIYEFEEQLRFGPIAVGFYLDTAKFQSYGGGVDTAEYCNTTADAHSMIIVGSGRERDIEYWLVRNSHGEDWGEQGYYKIKKVSECYDNEGFGQTMQVLVADSEEERREQEKENEKASEKSSKLQSYNFYKNPNYDWTLVARELKVSDPPKLPQEE